MIYKTLKKVSDVRFVKSYKSIMICKTKNLFPTSTAVGTLDGWNQSTARQFEEDKWYIGITANNYYEPSTIIEYELTGNYIYIKTKGNSYGIGKAFKCEPNQTYTMTCKWIENTNYMRISIGFYDENGNYLSYDATPDERYTFTTPANCKWFTVCFVGGTGGSSYVYNMQLEEGSTPTAFVPNGYLQSYKKSLACKTKNLFNPLGREDANPTGNWPITKYDVGNVIYRGLSYSGYYQLDESNKCDVTVSGAVITVVEKTANYGIGYIVKCNPNTVYTLSFETNFNVIVSIFLDLEGNKIGDENWSRTFTTPNNAYYLLVVLASLTAGTYFIKNLQLELGDTATEYHPYGYL